MKCPHCNKHIYFESKGFWLYKFDIPDHEMIDAYQINHTFCPACDELIVLREEGLFDTDEWNHGILTDICFTKILYPKFPNRPVEPEVPKKYADEYREAAAVISISPKASAALSRRLLQTILREECNVKKNHLSKEIDEFINTKGIPSYLVKAIDAIRNIGNFAAHPSKDINTGEIVEVETREAEWLLDVFDSLFDYVFVQPTKLEQRRKKLNIKLESMDKPPMK